MKRSCSIGLRPLLIQNGYVSKLEGCFVKLKHEIRRWKPKSWILLLGMALMTNYSPSLAGQQFTIKCKLTVDRVRDSYVEKGEYLPPYKDDAFTWTIDIERKEYYWWATKTLDKFAKLDANQMCFSYFELDSGLTGGECIQRFTKEYKRWTGHQMLADKEGICEVVNLRQIPKQEF
jgi:hypothetical protein